MSETANTVTWFEIPAADLDVASAFYRDVFGWDLTPGGEGYLMIGVGDRMIGGLYAAEEPIGDGAVIVVEVDDMEETLERIAALGGTVLVPRMDIGEDMGWYAQFRDASGLKVGLSTVNPAA